MGNCKDCKWWDVENAMEITEMFTDNPVTTTCGLSECRKNPPPHIDTKYSDWCGAFEPRNPKPRKKVEPIRPTKPKPSTSKERTGWIP